MQRFRAARMIQGSVLSPLSGSIGSGSSILESSLHSSPASPTSAFIRGGLAGPASSRGFASSNSEFVDEPLSARNPLTNPRPLEVPLKFITVFSSLYRSYLIAISDFFNPARSTANPSTGCRSSRRDAGSRSYRRDRNDRNSPRCKKFQLVSFLSFVKSPVPLTKPNQKCLHSTFCSLP